jgi:hypothetical protein
MSCGLSAIKSAPGDGAESDEHAVIDEKSAGKQNQRWARISLGYAR